MTAQDGMESRTGTAPGAAPPEDIARLVMAEQVSLLYRQSVPGLVATLINGIILCAVLWGAVPAAHLLLWYGGMAAVTSLRFVLTFAYRRARPDISQVPRWRDLFVVGAGASGLLWGMVGYALMPGDSLLHQLFVVFVLAGMAAGAVPFFSPVFAAYVVFVLPTLLPFLLWLILQGDWVYWAMATVTPLFIGVLLVTARRIRNTLADAMLLRFQNNSLVSDLSDAMVRLETYNRELTDEVAERVRAEEALRDSETHTRAILDNVVDAIVTMDETGGIESFNRSAERIFGYSAARAVGRHVSMLFDEAEREAVDDYLRYYLNTGKSQVSGVAREFTGRRWNGVTFPVEMEVSDMQLRGRRLLICMLRDITERKKVERMKDEFISTVSHELRTPLSSIRGSLSLLSHSLDEEVPADVRSLVDIAYKNSERLVRLVIDILDFDEIQSGGMTFRPRLVELMPVVEQALAGARDSRLYPSADFRIVEALPGAKIYTDSERLQQVLMHLLSNAAKFSPAGQPVEISATHSDGLLRVAVADHGPGIPEDFWPQMFQKFSRLDATDGRQQSGAGLGLGLSKAIIERLGGRIGFFSELGKGSTFYIELPEHRA